VCSSDLVVQTGEHTGRSPRDKFLVEDPSTRTQVWWGKINQPFDPKAFLAVQRKLQAYLQGKDAFVQDLATGADERFRTRIRLISEKSWAALFAQDLFIRLPQEKLANHRPDLTIYHCPDFQVDPSEDHCHSSALVALDLARHVILICGTSYAGEVKKAVFTALNYAMPAKGVLPMHCSANVGQKGDVALFFGLSGTGKTTLSSNLNRRLIGDDEHGWSRHGVFNFEGGCYAKTIHLRPELEPLIWSAAQRYGAVLENVPCDPVSRELDFDDDHLTENTRGAYPIDFIPNHVPEGRAGHPNHIFFLTADAFGVLPPLARLNPDQALYYFLSGYTAKLAGTETGLSLEPQATFSACFGAPFLPLHPKTYATMLGERIQEHGAQVWLVNTGWTGGPFGVGQRIKLQYTRALIDAALSGALDDAPFVEEPHFRLSIPRDCPGVPAALLNPAATWKGQAAYRVQAERLQLAFRENFSTYQDGVPPTVHSAGP
jgi:phosphoenolpyruvate carboxykinase (ATP)